MIAGAAPAVFGLRPPVAVLTLARYAAHTPYRPRVPLAAIRFRHGPALHRQAGVPGPAGPSPTHTRRRLGWPAAKARGKEAAMRILINWLVVALALAALGLTGVVHFATVGAWIAGSVAVGLINALLRPILRLLTLPLNVLTLGLFGWVLNAALLLLASRLVPGFVITGFGRALEAAVLFALLSWLLHRLWIFRRAR
jgi:putative membrane protein